MDAQQVRAIIIGYAGECTCHEGYSGRNIEDPDCTYHRVAVDELAADIAAAMK